MSESNGYLSPLARAETLVADIQGAADQIDRDREIPAPLVQKMKDLGLFRLLVPKELGGEEMDWLEYLDVVRTIAYADGSVAWCFNQGTVFATTSSRAPAPLANEVWGDAMTVVSNGPPQGVTAESVEGGTRLSGQWVFSSGCRHANWVAAVSPRPARLHLIPREEVEFVDVWQVPGLRGTGSFSFEADGLFVPTDRTMALDTKPHFGGPLYVVPQHLMFACGFGCVALGVARAALDATEAFAADKTPRFGSRPLAENPVVHEKIGKAEAGWRAAKALLHETVREVSTAVQANHSISVEERIHLRMAGTHAIRESARVVDILYNLSGSSSIFASAAIQRRFQDAHVITQQVQGREAHYETVGQYFVGEEPVGVY